MITHGNKNLREVALTFDDGPSPNFTAKVLDVLEAYRIKATFFCIGRQVQAFPDLTLRAYKAGYEIENHSWSHPVMTGLSLEGQYWQLQHTNNTIERVTHQRPLVIRPPYGAYNASSLQLATSLRLVTVAWDVDAHDWSRPGTDTILHNVLDHVKNGSIILMHDGGGDRSQTLAALPTIIETLFERGYRFVTIRQLLSRLPHEHK
ncbi:oligosaccharide deacetylase [Ktedonobacter sp. SOSP1-52]|uniref:polysaccharide deacetylase family protein n=1 Tax=Ktedonobacter sp. SOSP1-52 TaxID=2778366 RepID=UPI001916A931|nr:polysaccharide deacetylase family protein [Ktedonobacter sp. SOSP1-52]GHO62445.1 oligosaccharide deacetylase [Ktedonobacter sp. SOSP1-52]